MRNNTIGKILKTLFFPVFALALSMSGCSSDSEEELYPGTTDCDTTNVTYYQSLAPVFEANCNTCHSGTNASNNIRTDSYASVKTNISRIRGAVNHESGFASMPQDGAKLKECDLTKLDIWIRQGMPEN